MNTTTVVNVTPNTHGNTALALAKLATLSVDQLKLIDGIYKAELLALSIPLFWSKTVTFSSLGLTAACGLIGIKTNNDKLVFLALFFAGVTAFSGVIWLNYYAEYSSKNLWLNHCISFIEAKQTL